MPDEAGNDQKQPETADMRQVGEVLRSLGQIINTTKLYGPAHKVVVQTTESAFRMLEKIFTTVDTVNMSVADDDLLVDGRTVDLTNPLILAFSKQMVALGASGFSLTKGMSKTEFDTLMQLLTTNPDTMTSKNQFADMVAGSAMSHVTAKTATYQLVTEEEVVIKKDEMEGSGGQTDEMIRQIVSFLKGEKVDDPNAVMSSIAGIATDVDKLAELVIEAAKAEGEGATPMVGKIIECVRRFYETALDDPSAQTQTGKKQLIKTLSMLEEKIEEKLHELTGQEDSAADETLEEAVEEMTTELEIDALAAEYARKYKGIEKAQKRILKFIKTTAERNPDAGVDLRERLVNAGLSDEDWNDLLARSRGKELATDGRSAGGTAVSQVLAQMLAELKEAETGEKVLSPEELETVIGRITREMEVVSSKAELQIADMGLRMREAIARPDEAEDILSRREMIAMLAELGQEICQPLAVITASLDMVGGGRLGAVTDPQREMIQLASEGAERIQKLADKLIEIAGVPEGRNPDAGILGDIYRQ